MAHCCLLYTSSVLVQFTITNGGSSGYTILVDGNSAGTFSYVPGTAQSASILVAGDGASHNIIVQDLLDVACAANVGVVTPDCSGGGNPCLVSLSPAITGGCINNMVPVLLNVTGTNTDTVYTAVSYTHLDVYKRQFLMKPNCLFFLSLFLIIHVRLNSVHKKDLHTRAASVYSW